ncbi:hypothetical protein OG568_47490 [Streptomyces sp. NBC_01450]|uniref:hypothetical protein n=1 Tax=Streptomyces sp. NBC_01450 TaxID=2903871 RepID=UPI002E3625EC|nr:hypothetical protein [Streptomyces sp. NBC_01450]
MDTVTDEQWSELDAADAVVFGTPTYMGDASADFPDSQRPPAVGSLTAKGSARSPPASRLGLGTPENLLPGART